jgi:hypothetical protein
MKNTSHARAHTSSQKTHSSVIVTVCRLSNVERQVLRSRQFIFMGAGVIIPCVPSQDQAYSTEAPHQVISVVTTLHNSIRLDAEVGESMSYAPGDHQTPAIVMTPRQIMSIGTSRQHKLKDAAIRESRLEALTYLETDMRTEA